MTPLVPLPWQWARRLLVGLATLAFTISLGLTARGQQELTPEEERIRVLTEAEEARKKAERDKSRPPVEVFLSQVAPFDVLPYVKENHWSTIGLESRANHDDWDGSMITAPVPLMGLPWEVSYRRELRMPKGQRTRASLQMLLTQYPAEKEIAIELIRPDAIRADEIWPAPLRRLERHQMLVVVLSKEANDSYASWKRYGFLYPRFLDRYDIQAAEQSLFYRFVLPQDVTRPLVSPHPLTWTTTSHVIWDGMPPDNLNTSQQQAMLDWLHWGGQLTIVGGAGPAFSVLRDSFLSPYLPAEESGENLLLTQDDLRPLAREYPPPARPRTWEEEQIPNPKDVIEPTRRLSDRYQSPVLIQPKPGRRVYLAALQPKPGAVGIPLGESSDRLVGVEWRVGRGRVLMLAISLTDPAIASWPGLDTFIRRVVLRRPEDSRALPRDYTTRAQWQQATTSLPAPDLTWVRYLGRDLGIALPPPPPPPSSYSSARTPVKGRKRLSAPVAPPDPDDFSFYASPNTAACEWSDATGLPRICRDALELASGIKIPGTSFVLTVIVAYVMALVPLNWLLCRYVFGRRELAWVIAPALALGFAIAVERAANYDVGYNTACDEIDLIEIHGAYPRAMVSRFASLFTTGRTRYRIAFPNDPTALALPLDRGRSMRGEDVVNSTFTSYPSPALEGFLVQPRSLSMFRAEQMLTLDGAIQLEITEGARRVVNQSGLELRDATLVDVAGPGSTREVYLGTIASGASVEVKEVDAPPTAGEPDPFSRERLLRLFRKSFEDRPENRGEIRLVAWTPRAVSGMEITPEVDRRRALAAVVVHLRYGPPPNPAGPNYDARPGGDVSLKPGTDALRLRVVDREEPGNR